jgi:hypothetical protein
MPDRRPPEDADAQALRAAVILDELDFPGFDQPDERTGCIVVEVRSNWLGWQQHSVAAAVLPQMSASSPPIVI